MCFPVCVADSFAQLVRTVARRPASKSEWCLDAVGEGLWVCRVSACSVGRDGCLRRVSRCPLNSGPRRECCFRRLSCGRCCRSACLSPRKMEFRAEVETLESRNASVVEGRAGLRVVLALGVRVEQRRFAAASRTGLSLCVQTTVSVVGEPDCLAATGSKPLCRVGCGRLLLCRWSLRPPCDVGKGSRPVLRPIISRRWGSWTMSVLVRFAACAVRQA